MVNESSDDAMQNMRKPSEQRKTARSSNSSLITGMKVKHKQFGEGKVIEGAEIHERYIVVNFSKDDSNRKFAIPDAFVKGFLTIEKTF